MRNILITIKKELRSIFRDKKTVITMFIYPILIPCMVMLYGNIGDSVEDEGIDTKIGVNYELSVEEKAILNEMKLDYITYSSKDEMNKAYKNNEINCYISYENNKYVIYVNESNTDGMVAGEMATSYLEAYNSVLISKYLVEKGIDVEEAYNQISYDTESLENHNYMTSVLLSVSLTYTILAIALSASNMAISTTATEKENGTLETILTFPIKKGELITGKYLSSVIVGFIAALISFILMSLSFYWGASTYEIFKDVSLNINPVTVCCSLIICFLASVFISGVAMYLTAFAKSYKEAQSKISLINMLGLIPMFVSILNVNISTYYYLIPMCNYVQVLQELLIGKTTLYNFGLTVVSTIVLSYLMIKLIIKLYNSEKILFNN